jgi:hypothetical protein
MIFDCHGPAPRGTWIDTYTIDLTHNRYCEANCGSITRRDRSTVILDLYGDHLHSTILDLTSGHINAYSRKVDGGWSESEGYCQRVRRSRYTRLE